MTQFSLGDFLNSNKPYNGKFYTIAIDGRGGAGKSSFASYFRKLVPGFTLLFFDDYFEPVEGELLWGSLNKVRFQKDVIEPLKRKNTILYRPYDWHEVPHIKEKSINVDKGLCVEGCFSFEFDLDWDLKIWVETPVEICLKRGIERDQRNMGYKRAERVWKQVWLPPENDYIKRVRPLEIANLVVDGTKPFEDQLI